MQLDERSCGTSLLLQEEPLCLLSSALCVTFIIVISLALFRHLGGTTLF
jgi:hypothetical protein